MEENIRIVMAFLVVAGVIALIAIVTPSTEKEEKKAPTLREQCEKHGGIYISGWNRGDCRWSNN